ncbi:GntR family transcriptional regulator [Azospirillum cavernae]|uniref:GntR family transcriptional regulator n=1 Tax=Azospirillum cavernae TaxID=2320860 RepID=A0A418VSW2_9PROT|nr:GntR family transcriptional regulator [Azospirillum cavernae]RJF79489.1 GntR family transcriptional regulator [Azospirillum cavernae]
MPALPHPPAVTDRAADRLRAAIMAGELKPGEQLVEADLVERLGVSRNTLREAFRQLCREGLAEHHRHCGVTVRAVTADDVREIFTIRRTLELQAVAAAPAILPPPRLAAMRDCVTAAQDAAAARAWRTVGTHSLRLHGEIVRLIGSPLLDGFFASVLAQLRLSFAVNPDEAAFQAPWIARDAAIVERLAVGDAGGAADALRLYLDESEQGLLARFPSR